MTPTSDPVFAALERYRTAATAYAQSHPAGDPAARADGLRVEESANRRMSGPWLEALTALYRTAPTTLPGLRAYAEVLMTEEEDVLADLGLPGHAVLTLLRSVTALAERAGEEDRTGVR